MTLRALVLAPFALAASCRAPDGAPASAEPQPVSAGPQVPSASVAAPVPAAPVASVPVASVAPPPSAAPVRPKATWGKTEWRFVAQVHPSLPPFTFTIPGTFAPEPEPRARGRGTRGWVSTRDATRVVVDDGQGRRQTLARKGPDWAPPQALHLSFRGGSHDAGDFALEDLDADGYADVRLRIGLGPKTEFSQAWLYNPKNGLFEELVEFRSLSGPELDGPGCIATRYWTVDSVEREFGALQGRRLVWLGAQTIFYTEEPRRVERSGKDCATWRREQAAARPAR